MLTKTFAVSLLGFATKVSAAGSALIDYKSNGANWGDTYPLCKYGEEQTPIDLTKSGTKRSDLMQVNGFGYQNMVTATTTRNANTIVTNVGDGEF